MKLTYDLHVHTALSPCGEEEMSPNNIVNMALLNDLDVIAITDHNSCENTRAVLEVAKGTPLLVIPGMEIETREEIHVVCLFSDLDSVYNVQKQIYAHLPPLRNNKKVFGEQLLFDEEDEIIGRLERLVAFATDLSIDEVKTLVESNGGVFIPAHIDRPSYSILSNLGMIPSNMKLKTLEISRFADYEAYSIKYPQYRIIQCSDAHELGFLGICRRQIDVKVRTVEGVLEALKSITVAI